MNLVDNIPHTAGALVGALAILALVYLVVHAVYTFYLHPLAGYPGQKLAALTNIWYAYYWTSGNWPLILRELHKRYGDVVRVSPNELSFATVEAERDIYSHASKNRRPFEKGPNYDRGTEHLSIVDSKGEEHRRQRKALSNAFSAKALQEQEDVVQQYVQMFTDKLGTWSAGPDGIEVVETLNWLTFDIIGDLAFGESFDAVKNGKTHPWVSVLIDTLRELDLVNLRRRLPFMNLVIPFLVPSNLGEIFANHWKYTTEMTKKRIAKKDTITRADFFQHILDKGTMGEEVLIQNASVLIIAGSETTATALSGCMYYLNHNKDCLKKLQEEVRGTFDSLDQINGQSTQQLPYTLACIKESMRIYPPVPAGLGRISHGAPVDGHWVPAGTLASVPAWLLHRDPRYWKDPDCFKPERWIDDGFGDNKDAYVPFSIGARACIGINLAYMEMRLILAKMVWQYDFELLNMDVDWERDNQMFVLWQKPNLHMKFRVREGLKA